MVKFLHVRCFGCGCVALWLLAVWLSIAPFMASAADPNVEDLLKQARAAFNQGKPAEALALATKAIEANPKNPNAYLVRAKLYEAAKQHEKAVADCDQALKLEPRAPNVYQLRGSEYFKLGHIQESIADFDKFIELTPAQAPYHWQRGISLYYAGRYEDGRKQFESHQTVNPDDVENAVWHFLCVARQSGVARARASLIAIKHDGRVPMMQIHALFGGKGTADEVLAAAKAGNPSAAQLEQQLFYAHLYLGLYYEATGDAQRAREHITKAATEFKADHYMGDVARIHLQLLRKKSK